MKITEKAILNAVSENNQDELLAKALIAWFDELSSGNESITDVEIVDRRLSLLLQKTVVELNEIEEEIDTA